MRKSYRVWIWSCVIAVWCSLSWAQTREVAVNAMPQAAGQSIQAEPIDNQEVMGDDQKNRSAIVTETVSLLDVSDLPLEEVLNRIAGETGIVFILTEPVTDRVSICITDINVWDLLKILLQPMDLAYYRTDGAVHIMPAATFLARYGYDFPIPFPVKTVHLNYADPMRILTKLEAVKSPEGHVWADVKNHQVMMIDDFESLQAMQRMIRESDYPLVTQSIVLKHRSYEDVKEALAPMRRQGIERISVSPDGRTVTLEGAAEAIEAMSEFLSRQDRPQSLTFRLEILRIDLNQEHPQGVDWEAIVSNYQVAALSTPDSDAKDPQEILEIGMLTQEDYGVLIEALDTVGDLNKLISFEQTLMQEQPESMTIETNDPFWALRPGARRDPEHPAMLDSSGFEMAAAVQLHRREDRFVMDFLPRLHWMHRGPRDSIYTGQETARIEFDPTEVIVLGGLIRTEETARTRKVPLLGDLPMVGGVFRLERKKSENKEYVIFLKPQPETETPD